MNNLDAEQVLPKTSAFPLILRFTDVRLYAFTTGFVVLSVAIPWACHQIHPLTGPTFLPMFFFILPAGLLFGWRAGLVVGFLTPLVSYGISGMPFLWRLPQIVIEACVFGLAAGLLRERFRLNVIWSLLGAMVIGRLALGLAVLAIHLGEVNPLIWVWQVTQQGWPGIAIQLVFLPVIVRILDGWFSRENYDMGRQK